MAIRFSAVAAGLLAGALMTTPALAQSESGSGSGQAQQQQVEVTDKKFDAFVGAALAVMDVRETWTPKIKGAQSESKKQEMVKSARQEMSKAVEDHPGISTKEYIAIARQARNNPQLAKRIQSRVQEERGGGSGQQ